VNITRYRAVVERSGFSWSAVWPGYLLAAFASLALMLLLPGGPGRALVAIPVLLGVPGALTLGAVQARRFVDAAAFGGLAVMLGVIWLVFAALVLSAMRIRISAVSVYACLLVACVILAVAAQWRLLRQGSAQPAADVLSAIDEPGGLARLAPWYAAVALLAGAALLGGGALAYVRGPHPAPTGYTWLAWTGMRAHGIVGVGPAGRTLPLQIRHEQPGTGKFRLSAGWASDADGKQHALAAPRTITIGADQTVQVRLTIPQPPGGCAYRVVVTLTALGTAHPRSWSVNVDVRAEGRRGCAS
jgi:hypothetical protein